MKGKVLHVIIGLILGLALFVAMGHAAPRKQKGTGLPGTVTPAVKQVKTVHKNSIGDILRKGGTVIGLGLDIAEYAGGKVIWAVQKADSVWDEYVEGK